MSKRRRSALTTLALAVAALFALPASPASAGTATTPNACANSVTANFSQIGVTTSGDDGVNFATPGQALSESASQSAAIPGAIFVAGYNLGLLQQGVNNVPANVRSTIEATNTVQGSQNTNVVGGTPPNGTVSVSTTITDPDGTPGTGDETATDASFSVTYNNLSWTAGASGTIDYRQQSIAVAPPTAANNALLINALVGGVFNVQFRCAPGTVTPPDPGIITLIDPAGSFDTTFIDVGGPSASAGPDQTVPSAAPLVTLDASATTDPDLPNDTLTYAWSQTGGPAVTLSDPTAVMPTFTAPAGPATLTFDVMVTDQAGQTSTDSVTINVSAPNIAPTANAGADQTVDSGAAVSLDGTGSTDPDGTIASYAWVQTAGPAVTLTGANTATPSFTAPTGPATLTFQLTVTDNNGATGTDSVTVNVNAGNIAPTANAGADQTVDSGATVNLNGTGSNDPDGTIASYAWVQTAGPAVTLTGANTATPSFTAPTGPASLTFELTVTDNDGATGTDSVTINVNPPPMPDATGVVIVNGPVSSSKTSKSFVFKLTNVGATAITVNESNITEESVSVNGTATGSVAVGSFTKTLNPGASTRVKLSWSYPAGSLLTGDTVVFHACVDVAGDIDPTNNCDDQSATAK